MSEAKKATAHYHLPGLFEFHELYRVFLPLFCTGNIFMTGVTLAPSTARRRTVSGAEGASAAAHRLPGRFWR